MAPKSNAALIHMIDWLGECEYEIYAWCGNRARGIQDGNIMLKNLENKVGKRND